MAQNAYLSTMTDEIAAAIKVAAATAPPPATSPPTPAQLREGFNAAISAVVEARKGIIPPGKLAPLPSHRFWFQSSHFTDNTYKVFDEKVPVEGGEITVRCLVPAGGEEETFGVFVWLHGGGAFLAVVALSINFVIHLPSRS